VHLTLDVLENSARGDILLQQLSKRERHDLAKVARPRVGRTIVTLEDLAKIADDRSKIAWTICGSPAWG